VTQQRTGPKKSRTNPAISEEQVKGYQRTGAAGAEAYLQRRSIAHEVNQPLAAAITNAEACLRWVDRASPDLDEARAAVRDIIRSANRGSAVISRIRGLLQKKQPSKTRLDINDLVHETVFLARRPAGNSGGNRIDKYVATGDCRPRITGTGPAESHC